MDSEKLHALFDDAWDFTMKESPLFATLCGDHRYADQLSRCAEEDCDRRNKKDEEFLERLGKISKENLSSEDRLNYEIFQQTLEESLDEYKFKSHFMPMNNVSGFHISLPELPNQVPLRSIEDYENYLSRLSQVERYIDEHIELMKRGIQEGYVAARVAVSGCEASISAQIVEPEKSPFYLAFDRFPSSFSAEDQVRLREKGQKILAESVIPAYQKLLQFFKEEYLPACREAIGASNLPQGREFYCHRVRVYTAPEYTPEEVHQKGHEEVKRIRAEMDKVIQQVEFEGTFDEFVQFLRTEPRFYATSEKDLLKEVSYLLKKMDGLLPQLFKKLPRMSYGIRPVPAFSAPKAPTAYYMRAAGDGSRAGFYYVNTYDLKSRPLYELETLSFHEAVPGHHLQISLQQELEDLPNFRRYTGFMAFIEGWALYSEKLALEVGCYEDPYNFFGHLIYEIWRATRLVVDTGIHYMGWTREQALEFMMANTALTQLNIESEVDRYIAWPGQALSYKMGEIKIWELRRKAEKEMGSVFDLRDFHQVVLESGGVPLSVLSANVNAYINGTAS